MKPSAHFDHLLKLIHQSLTLDFSQKQDLIHLLPRLTPEYIEKMEEVFETEQREIKPLLVALLEQRPDLLKEFRTLTKNLLKGTYGKMEQEERGEENPEELLNTDLKDIS